MFAQPNLSPPIAAKYHKCTIFMYTKRAAFSATKMISETHWLDVGSSLRDSMDKLVNIAKLRRKLLGSDATIFDCRISRELVFRDALHDDSPGNTPAAVADDPAEPGTIALKVIGTSGQQGLYNRHWFLSLLPDSMIVGSQWTPTPQWRSDFDNYAAALVKNSFGWIPLGNDPDVPSVKVTNIVYTTAVPRVATITAPGHGYATGDQVHFYGAQGKDIKAIQGPWQIHVVDGDSFTLDNFPVITKNPQFSKFGFVRKRILLFQAYAATPGYDVLNERKRGARTFLPRGRLPNRKPADI